VDIHFLLDSRTPIMSTMTYRKGSGTNGRSWKCSLLTNVPLVMGIVWVPSWPSLFGIFKIASSRASRIIIWPEAGYLVSKSYSTSEQQLNGTHGTSLKLRKRQQEPFPICQNLPIPYPGGQFTGSFDRGNLDATGSRFFPTTDNMCS